MKTIRMMRSWVEANDMKIMKIRVAGFKAVCIMAVMAAAFVFGVGLASLLS